MPQWLRDSTTKGCRPCAFLIRQARSEDSFHGATSLPSPAHSLLSPSASLPWSQASFNLSSNCRGGHPSFYPLHPAQSLSSDLKNHPHPALRGGSRQRGSGVSPWFSVLGGLIYLLLVQT